MGRQETKRALFVLISLNEYVPEDHLLRAVDHYLDLDRVSRELGSVVQPYWSAISRPRAHGLHADHWLLLGHTFRAEAVRRSRHESGIPLVLCIEPGPGAHGRVTR